MRDDPTVEDLAAREDVEPEDKVVDSLVLCDDQKPHNNDRITSLHQNTRTSISSVLFNCFLVVLNIGIFTFLYRQIFPYQPFQAVDCYEKAIDIAVMEITVSRVVLFVEAALEPMSWKGQPGLSPDPEATPDAGSTGMSDCEPISIYKPWETSSNGTYEVANHGPPQFKFTRGTSTQFRWSTSSVSFVSPHNSLPTIPDDEWGASIESDVPESTILGMPLSETGTPSPTARPREPSIIMNSDPPLSRLEILLKDIIGDLLVPHSITRGSLVYWFPDLAWSKATAMWFNFDLLLRDQRTHNASFGPQDLSDVPDDVPENYLDEVSRAHYSRISSHNSNPTSNRKRASSSSTTMCRPSKHPTPRQWDLSQADNDTAKRLTENAFHHDDLDLGQKRLIKLRSLWGIVENSDFLNKACEAMDEINQRITQALSTDYRIDIPWGQQIQAVNRLRYVAPFLSDIAAVRLREMSRRASRGALLVREIDRRQHKLAEDILEGFVTADFLLHFPPIEGLLIDMKLLAEWFKTEVASITNLWKSRSERCDAAE
ncbi:hypothetical protein FCOIX_9501 [Fusarium coicis]|nr:hypothetical protein FCOIX_9501 [Fusarium coicis]